MWSLLRRLRQRERFEADLDEEVRGYFETHVEREIARGLTRPEAMRRVRLAFEGPEQVKHDVREARMGNTMDSLWQDVTFAARMLTKSPGFSVFAVSTIALGLGANAAIFSLVDGVLLKSAGYPEPERLVRLWERHPQGGISLDGEPYRVIGVLPGTGAFNRQRSDAWIPLILPPNVARDYHFLHSGAFPPGKHRRNKCPPFKCFPARR